MSYFALKCLQYFGRNMHKNALFLLKNLKNRPALKAPHWTPLPLAARGFAPRSPPKPQLRIPDHATESITSLSFIQGFEKTLKGHYARIDFFAFFWEHNFMYVVLLFPHFLAWKHWPLVEPEILIGRNQNGKILWRYFVNVFWWCKLIIMTS